MTGVELLRPAANDLLRKRLKALEAKSASLLLACKISQHFEPRPSIPDFEKTEQFNELAE